MYLGEVFGTNDDDDDDDDDDNDDEKKKKKKEKKHKALYPALGPKRGEAMKWIVWTNTTLAAAGQRLSIALPAHVPGADKMGERALLSDEKGKAEEEKAKEGIRKVLRILDAQLNGRNFLLGDAYSLADTHVWSFMSWVTVMGVSVEEFGAVKEWMARVGGRPALEDE